MNTTDILDDVRRARSIVAQVRDPELPVLTIEDLGVLRDVRFEGERVEVTITPTYSGCPAMDVIRSDIEAALRDNGFAQVQVRTVLSPPWTTEWISEAGRRKLADHGIAPPGSIAGQGRRTPGARSVPIPVALSVRCPQCASSHTREVSRFGATACKALWTCNECREPFEYFKAI